MSIEAIMARKDLNLCVFTGKKYNYSSGVEVKAMLEGYANGIELKIEEKGTDFDAVMDELWSRWCRATQSIPELAASMIEHQPTPPLLATKSPSEAHNENLLPPGIP